LNQNIPADINRKVKNRRGGVSLRFQLLPALAAVLLTGLLWLIASRQAAYDGPSSTEPAIAQIEQRTPTANPVPAAIYQSVRHDAVTVTPDLVPESQAAPKTFHLRLGWVKAGAIDGKLQFGLIDSEGLAVGPTLTRSGSPSGSLGTIGSGGSFQISPVSGGGVQPAATLTANPATWNGGDYTNSHNWTDTGNWAGIGANPDGGGTTIIHFAGTVGPNPFNDYGAYTQFNQILFDSGSTAFTLSGAAIKLAPNGATVAKIENNSTSLQTVSFNTSGQSIGFVGSNTANLELDPTSGDLTINNDIFVDNTESVIHVFGSHILTLNGSLGNGAATAALTIESTATVVLAANNSYTGETVVKGGGTVQFGTAASSTGRANSSTFRLGDGVSNADSAAAITLNLATTAGGQSIDSVINPRLGTTGLESLNSQNTSGTNSLTNHIGLDHNFTITQAAGTGALNITQAKGVDNSTGYDIKTFTATFTPGAGGTINDSGTIYSSTGGGIVLMNGAGTLTLSGTNTYSGGTTLSSGTLNINSTTALGATAAAFTINGGTIDNTTAGALTLANNNAVTWGGDFSFGGTRDLNMGTGAVTMGASRIITLGGSGSTLTFGGTVTNTSGASPTLTVNGAGNTLSLGSMNLANSATNRTVSIGGSGNVAITGVVANGGGSPLSKLTYAGTGTLTLSGASTFTGGFTLNSGTLAIGADSTGAVTNGPLGTGLFTLTATPNTLGTAAVQAVGASHSIANAFNFTTDWTVNGSQNLSFTGTTQETNSDTLTNNIASGKVLTFAAVGLATTATARTLTVAGTGNTTFGGIISNGASTGGNIIVTNTGATIFSGANSYSGTGGNGTTVGSSGGPNAGTLQLVGAGTLGATTNPLIVRGGIVDLNGTTQTISTLALGNGASGSTASVTIGAGNLNLGGDVTYSAVNNPNGATISGVGGGKLSLNGNRNFIVNDSTAATADLTISAIIQDGSVSSGITKQNLGTMILSAVNTYTGTTAVNGGTLFVNGSLAAASAVSVTNAGSVLGGTGTVNGTVTVNASAAILGGNGTTGTTLTVANNLTLNSSSIIELALGPSGTHSTLARTGGTWTFATNQTFTFLDLGAQTTTYDNIITGLAGDPGGEGSWTITNPLYMGTFVYDGTGNIDLTLTAVPEPGTWVVGALALGILLATQRRRLTRLVKRAG
jgi:autotransporter-associated beta strand protein